MFDIYTMKQICAKAHEAGVEAVKTAQIRPMLVGSETHLFSGVMGPSTIEYVADGVCGFAWIMIYPNHKGNTRLGKEERKILDELGFSKSYTGKSYDLWVSAYNQSMQKKEAYARAYAEVLHNNGINASYGSRMD